jgi:hypothetical protein
MIWMAEAFVGISVQFAGSSEISLLVGSLCLRK